MSENLTGREGGHTACSSIKEWARYLQIVELSPAPGRRDLLVFRRSPAVHRLPSILPGFALLGPEIVQRLTLTSPRWKQAMIAEIQSDAFAGFAAVFAHCWKSFDASQGSYIRLLHARANPTGRGSPSLGQVVLALS